jgi:hypothetical protein
MKPTRRSRHRFTGFAVWQLYFFTISAVVLGIVGSLSLCDAHFLNRMGALMVAVGAIMIVVQFRYDLEVERSKAEFLAKTESEVERIEGDATASPVIRAIAGRILREENEATLGNAEEMRSRAVLHVAIFTSTGVLIDGFGDYLTMAILAAAGLHCH